MIRISQVIESIISRLAARCDTVLVGVGASEPCRCLRVFDHVNVIRRALQMPLHQWRVFGLQVGSAEWAAGVVVCYRHRKTGSAVRRHLIPVRAWANGETL